MAWVKHRNGEYEWKLSREERSQNLRYKRPALESLELHFIMSELDEIQETCGEIHWMEQDEEILLTALDGDDEALYEFKILFSDMEQKADELYERIRESYLSHDDFNDCMTGLLGNRYNLIGYDGYQEDYYSLTGYDTERAFTEAGKRIMRLTKAEMLDRIGQCMGITLAYLDLRFQYDYLKATIDILRDENTSFLNIIKDIEKVYLEADAENFSASGRATQELDRLIRTIPDKVWCE